MKKYNERPSDLRKMKLTTPNGEYILQITGITARELAKRYECDRFYSPLKRLTAEEMSVHNNPIMGD